jgi:alpha-N-arabinofuranosidase
MGRAGWTRAVGAVCWGLIVVTGGAAAPDDGIRLTVTNQTLHRIDRRMFGQFMERPSWGEIGVEGALVPGPGPEGRGAAGRLQPKVRQLLEAMQVPVIRFPGGTDVDYLDWRDMVSNVPGRAPERPISTGHLGHRVSNHFGYDEFLRFCAETGAEAIVVVNFRDGLLQKKPLPEAAAHAAALVAYCNTPVGAPLPEGMFDWPGLRAKNGRTKPYGARYFQIGNETWAFLNEARKLAPGGLAPYYVKCLKAYVDAMKAVDPKIEIIVDGHDGSLGGVVPLAREQLGGRIDYFATHFYRPWAMREVFRGEQKVAVEDLSAADIWYAWTAITEFDEQGQSVYRSPGLDAARRSGYRVAITEWNWNGQWRAGPSPLNSRWAKGVGAAGFVHAMMRSGDVIDIGCQSMLVGMGWGISAVFTDPAGVKDPVYLPTGQLTAFYSKHHGDRLVRLESSGVPTYEQPYRMGGIAPHPTVAALDVLATADQTAVYVHAINRSFDNALEVTIDLSGFRAGEGAVHRLVQGRLNDTPQAGQPAQIGHESTRPIPGSAPPLHVTLPERSVSCIEIPLAS